MAKHHQQVSPVDPEATATDSKAAWDWNALLRKSLPPSSSETIFKHSTGVVTAGASSKNGKKTSRIPATKEKQQQQQPTNQATSMFKLPKATTKPLPPIKVDESSNLPNRLMDFFCVVGAATNDTPPTASTCTSDQTTEPLLLVEPKQKLQLTTSPTQVTLKTKVVDCYPEPDTYTSQGMEFPHHIHKFVFPNGCCVALQDSAASLMTFVLTLSNGNRLYGASLKMYEDIGVTRSDLADAIVPADPPWTNPQYYDPQSTLYVPKCLVVVSQYALFEVLRKFLQQLYRIYRSPRGSPLPLERYIANMMHDVPLPPPGRMRVHYDRCFLTTDTSLRMERPAPNQLPLVNVSYQPLFRALSLTNVLTIWGILWQEGRVVLCSRYYALLTPVAEALLSLLYPLVWEGIYVPVLPSDMVDVLDAPIPFLVGMDSRLLEVDTQQQRRPRGVVLVDLDEDVVHLGWDDACGDHEWIPRTMPDIPYAAVMRLKVQLEGLADHLYLVPPCGIKGRILTGDGRVLDNAKRETYGQVTRVEMARGDDNHRHFILSNAERAFVDETHEELQEGDFLVTRPESLTRESSISSLSHSLILASAHGVGSTQGSVADSMKVQGRAVQAHVDRLMSLVGGREYATPPSSAVSLNENELLQKRFEMATYFYDVEFIDSGSKNESEEKEKDDERNVRSFGFDVRWAFVQFVTTIFLRYRIFLKTGSDGSVVFQKEAFLKDQNLSKGNQAFMAEVLESQMFDKFLRERTGTSDTKHPQVILFDEFLVARNNQMNRGWGSRAKVETPFMEDKQWRIREVITPAAPYAVGIIWGNSYKYNRFPKLRANDFVANSSGSTLISLCDAGSTLLCGSISLACWDYDSQTCIQT